MNKRTAITFLTEVAIGNVEKSFEKFVAEDFLHHNVYFKGDRQTLMLAMKESANMNPGTILEIKKVVEENDQVVTYSHLRHKKDDEGFAVTHILRFKDNKIVEMWDVIMPIPKEKINENGVF